MDIAFAIGCMVVGGVILGSARGAKSRLRWVESASGALAFGLLGVFVLWSVIRILPLWFLYTIGLVWPVLLAVWLVLYTARVVMGIVHDLLKDSDEPKGSP